MPSTAQKKQATTTKKASASSSGATATAKRRATAAAGRTARAQASRSAARQSTSRAAPAAPKSTTRRTGAAASVPAGNSKRSTGTTRQSTRAAGSAQKGRAQRAPAQPDRRGSYPTWADVAVRALEASGGELRAREIVEWNDSEGTIRPHQGRTPERSANRDLHAAIRRGHERLRAGSHRGTFTLAR